jgi:tetratricopeptide (TPR) repeat protein
MDFLKRLVLLLIITTTALTVHAQNDKKQDEPDKEVLLEYYQTQRYAEAAKYLAPFYKEEHVNEKALAQLGYVNLMAGNLSEAENIYLKLYALQPKSLPVLFSLANIQVRRGDDNKAKTYYKEIVALDSTNFNAYKQLAGLSAAAGEKINYLKKANSLNPTEAEVVFDLCQIYFKMNMHHKAREILEPALKADSANRQLLKMKMPISMAAKKYNDAIQTGQQLLSYGDSSTFVMNNLAKSYFLLLDYKNALDYFLKVKNSSEDNETLLYNIALSYRGLKDYKNASLYLNKTINEGISPKTASYYGLLGDSHENNDKNEEAITAYKRGLLFENNGSLYYNIALVYETKLNDKKNAIAYYNLYLKNFDDMAKNPKLASFIKNKIEELKR